ncbi:hypothetical protein INT44_004336 [Umbelopsis vinacea]|uniref:UBC core domain-containing protein n=1 Tax=Umbelopsis vinacea TaxID=44442 RepID=A0A8H7QA34_9FUNG|nr:hypothetical protein INT44_004336 [Umbelopsis vinacea]
MDGDAADEHIVIVQAKCMNLSLNPPEGVAVEDASTFKSWIILIVGAPGTLYEGEHFKLEFHFTPSYPLESPEVLFIKPFVPIHPHVRLAAAAD